MLRHARRHDGVGGPGDVGAIARAELPCRRGTARWGAGAAPVIAVRIEQVARDRLNAVGLEPARAPRRREPRHGEHAAPAAGRAAARCTRRASDGPILPAAPRIRTSPSSRLTQSISAADGSARRSSSAPRISDREPRITRMTRMTFVTGVAQKRQPQIPTGRPGPPRSPRCCPPCRRRAPRCCRSRHAVDQIVRQVHEPAGAQADDELRVIEGVVEHRGEARR